MEFKPKFRAVAPIALGWKLFSRDMRAALLRNAGERREYFCVRRKNILQTAEVFSPATPSTLSGAEVTANFIGWVPKFLRRGYSREI